MVKALLAVVIIYAVCIFDLCMNRPDASPEAGRKYNEERNSRVKWEACAEAREYCFRPPYMITTATANCFRVPTPEKQYCPK